MITYCVTISIDPQVEAEWIDWMQRVHVRDVVATGCFSECTIEKLIDAEAQEPTYLLRYRCESLQDYERYREQFAPNLQKDHSGRYAGRFRASRQLLSEIGRLGNTEAGASL